jgi:hypothetical protein
LSTQNLSPKVRFIIESAVVIARNNGRDYVDVQDLIESIFKEMDDMQVMCRLRAIGITVK